MPNPDTIYVGGIYHTRGTKDPMSLACRVTRIDERLIYWEWVSPHAHLLGEMSTIIPVFERSVRAKLERKTKAPRLGKGKTIDDSSFNSALSLAKARLSTLDSEHGHLEAAIAAKRLQVTRLQEEIAVMVAKAYQMKTSDREKLEALVEALEAF